MGFSKSLFLAAELVSELEACLKERDTLPESTILSPTAANGHNNPHSAYMSTKANGLARPDKRQIEQRIEEDRERHKRLKEGIWGVSGDDDDEFLKMWDEASDIGEDDYLLAEEEAMERRLAAEVH